MVLLRPRVRHLVVAGLAVLAVACSDTDAPGGDDAGTGSDAAAQAPEVDESTAGSQATDRTFTKFSGEEASFTTTYAGQPLVVNFWASWCPPCVAEMPYLERLHQDLGDQVTFVGINLQDERGAAESLVEQTGVTYDLAEDPDGALYADFGGFAMPMTYFVDANGTVVGQHGGLATEQQLRDLIQEHLLD